MYKFFYQKHDDVLIFCYPGFFKTDVLYILVVAHHGKNQRKWLITKKLKWFSSFILFI